MTAVFSEPLRINAAIKMYLKKSLHPLVKSFLTAMLKGKVVQSSATSGQIQFFKPKQNDDIWIF